MQEGLEEFNSTSVWYSWSLKNTLLRLRSLSL